MKVGLLSPSMPPFDSPEAARLVATLADRYGAHSLWVPEHVVLPASYDTPYPYSETGAFRCRPSGRTRTRWGG